MHGAPSEQDQIVETDIPARLDRLPWGRFHTLVVIALGVTWILDGLEVTLAGALSGIINQARFDPKRNVARTKLTDYR